MFQGRPCRPFFWFGPFNQEASVRASASMGALLALGLLQSCGREKPVPNGDWPLDFHLPLDPVYTHSGGMRPSGEGTLFFMHGDEPDQPRLVVSRLRVDLPPDQILENQANLGEEARLLDEGEIFTVQAVNASGLGLRRVVQPFPEFDSTLTLVFDTRVFVVGPWTYSFAWQQVPQDTALTSSYEGWMRRLRFLPGALEDTAGVAEEDLDSSSQDEGE